MLLTRTETPPNNSYGLFLKPVQGIKCFGIIWVIPATELHHCGVIAPCRYPLFHSLWKS